MALWVDKSTWILCQVAHNTYRCHCTLHA